MVRPMLDDIELTQVQTIEVDGDQVLVQHGVPALEGDFLQGLDRRATEVTLTGVLTGPEVGQGLKTLRDKFRAAEPASFVADISTATQVGQMLIEEMGVRELAGKPERFEYAFTLREHTPGTAISMERPPAVPSPLPSFPSLDEQIASDATNTHQATEAQIDRRQGTLEVIVEVSDASYTDFSRIEIRVEGQTEAGEPLTILLTEQENGVFRKTDVPAGEYTVTLQMGV